MAWPWRFFANDEELGKKNDDHRPPNTNGLKASPPWSVRKPAPALRRRRIAYTVCAVLFIYLFVRNIPSDLGPHPRWADTRVYKGSRQGNLAGPSTGPPTRKPPRPLTPSEAEEHYHDGPIKFYKLASSLHSVAKLGGQKEVNKNVLFAAASLKSASELIPLACEMARWERNDVHFAFMGRDDMAVQEVTKLNGASEEGCKVNWHDARPDYSRWSSEYRMEVSVAASLGHCHEFIHPQVIIVDDPTREDRFFVTAVRGKAMDLFKPLIELPIDATENLMWITRLDSASLAAWPRAYIDILIQAPSKSSGSLVRLLKSIEDADYFGARRPHLTVELPAEIDPPTWAYLENLIWPPLDWSGAPHVSQVSLRHRIPRRTTTPEEASARLAESFYPVRTTNSHVLLLSPQTELSPLYYHYLFYSLLEYKYSDHAKASENAARVMGISLELPTAFLNDTTDFIPPSKQRSPFSERDKLPEELTPFLWQAPNNNAALYFGEKWIELHSYIKARLSKPPTTSPRIISEKHPSWLEYILELMRARGWSLLYPGFFDNDVALATIHDELFQIPEEFSKKAAPKHTPTPPSSADQPLEADPSIESRKPPPNIEHPLLESSLTSLLPNQGDLPEIKTLPIISHDGRSMSFQQSRLAATIFSEHFRQSTGACGPGDSPLPYQWSIAADLFCHLDDVYDHHAARGPMSMEYDYPKSHPEAETDERDPDALNSNSADSAKQEAAYHLSRQAGASTNKAGADKAERNVDEEKALKSKNEPSKIGSGGSGGLPQTNAPNKDGDNAVQDESKGQLERQKKQTANDKKKSGTDPAKKSEVKPDKDSVKKESKSRDEAKKDKSQTGPTRGAFNKEKPKPPDEKEIEGIGGKSPGW
ncbi:MAG: hypothetical protein Q9164_004429 [Protoblastenia rupestris]